MERLIEEIPNFFTIWNVIFLAKAMGVTFLLTATLAARTLALSCLPHLPEKI